MYLIKKICTKWAINFALAAPDTEGDSEQKQSYFRSVYVTDQRTDYRSRVDSLDSDGSLCLAEADKKANLDEALKIYKFNYSVYNDGFLFTTHNPLKYVVFERMLINAFNRKLSWWRYKKFTRTQLSQLKRKEVINGILKLVNRNGTLQFNKNQLMTEVYGDWWFAKKNKSEVDMHISLTLSDLEANEEIEKCGRDANIFSVRGKLYRTIEQINSEDKKADFYLKQSRRTLFLNIMMVLLTATIAISALVQAKLL